MFSFSKATRALTLKVCHLNDPQRDQCIKKWMEDLIRALLLETRPANYDFPIIDPFTYDFTSIKFGNDIIGYECVANLSDLRWAGVRRTKVRSLQSEFKRNRVTLKAEVFIAKLFSTGIYSFVLTPKHLP